MGFFDFLKPPPTPPPASEKIPPEALMIWVHRRTHFEVLQAHAQAEGREPMTFIPINPVFGAAPALLTQRGPMACLSAELAGLGLSLNEAFQRGVSNTAQTLNTSLDAGGFYAWEGQYAEMLLVAGKLMASQLPLKGLPVVMLPAEGLTLMVGDDDVDALGRMLALAEKVYAKSENFRSLRAICWRDGPLAQEWLPAEGHPLRTRFVAAASKTRRHEAQSLHFALAPEGVPLAHLAVMPPERGGGLIAGWIREASVVLPRVDTVTLFDTDDLPNARVELDFATLLEVLPYAFEPLSFASAKEDAETPPVLFRARGACFPSPRERSFLIARQAFDRASPGTKDREVPAADLIALWDSGEPVLINAAMGKAVELTSSDRRQARVPRSTFEGRLEKLPPRDRLMLETSFVSLALIEAMASDLEPDRPTEPEAPGRPPIDLEALKQKLDADRPQLLSSGMAAALLKGNDASTEDAKSVLAILAQSLDPARLFPVVRPPDYELGSQNNELGMMASIAGSKDLKISHFNRVCRPLHDGLQLELVSDHGDQVHPLNGSFVTEKLRDPAWRSAMLNLESASLEPMAPTSTAGVFAGPWHDDYDASRVLLLPSLAAACKVKGAPLVFAPTLGRSWVTGSEDVVGIGAVLNEIDAFLESGDATSPYEFRQLLFGWPWILEQGRLHRWPVPSGHPLAAGLAALDEKLARRRASSRANVKAFAHAVTAEGVREPGEA